MKRRHSLLLVAIVLSSTAAIAMFSFGKRHSTHPPVSQQYWQFVGTTTAQESDPSKYVLITDPDGPDCTGSALRCVIEAPAQQGNPNLPDLSGSVTVLSTRN